MNLELAHEFTYRVTLKPPVSFGQGPLGLRTYFEAIGGEAEGPRFTATAIGGGGDWILAGADGYGRIDVRLQFQTHDDAFVYMHYFGLLEMNAAAVNAMVSGGSTTYEDQYFRTTPRMETGDAR